MCFLWTRVFVVWRSAMASSKNRWLELRVHPLELSTMREALYLPMTLPSASLFVSVSGVCCDCCGLCDVSKRGWLNLLSFLCLSSHCDGGRSVWNVMVNCYRYHQLAANSPWHPCTLAGFFCPLWLRSIVGKLTMFLSHCRQEVALVQQMSSAGCCLALTSLLHVFWLAAISEELLVQGPSSVHCGSEILGPQAHNVSEWQ